MKSARSIPPSPSGSPLSALDGLAALSHHASRTAHNMTVLEAQCENARSEGGERSDNSEVIR